MTSYMTNRRRISILKRPLNVYFLSFCGVIYQNLLDRRVYIAVSSYKLLFINFVENRCISPLKFKENSVFSSTSCDSATNPHLIPMDLKYKIRIR